MARHRDPITISRGHEDRDYYFDRYDTNTNHIQLSKNEIRGEHEQCSRPSRIIRGLFWSFSSETPLCDTTIFCNVTVQHPNRHDIQTIVFKTGSLKKCIGWVATAIIHSSSKFKPIRSPSVGSPNHYSIDRYHGKKTNHTDGYWTKLEGSTDRFLIGM